jgi:hypothetical protein
MTVDPVCLSKMIEVAAFQTRRPDHSGPGRNTLEVGLIQHANAKKNRTTAPISKCNETTARNQFRGEHKMKGNTKI